MADSPLGINNPHLKQNPLLDLEDLEDQVVLEQQPPQRSLLLPRELSPLEHLQRVQPLLQMQIRLIRLVLLPPPHQAHPRTPLDLVPSHLEMPQKKRAHQDSEDLTLEQDLEHHQVKSQHPAQEDSQVSMPTPLVRVQALDKQPHQIRWGPLLLPVQIHLEGTRHLAYLNNHHRAQQAAQILLDLHRGLLEHQPIMEDHLRLEQTQMLHRVVAQTPDLEQRQTVLAPDSVPTREVLVQHQAVPALDLVRILADLELVLRHQRLVPQPTFHLEEDSQQEERSDLQEEQINPRTSIIQVAGEFSRHEGKKESNVHNSHV
mmetsp:Transcript_10306/g.38263  ORF Transcript_10306/g.38263 Transcript_10306/m.38263 type:complete len:317 (+) Transcript_10306:3296-4246(+)